VYQSDTRPKDDSARIAPAPRTLLRHIESARSAALLPDGSVSAAGRSCKICQSPLGAYSGISSLLRQCALPDPHRAVFLMVARSGSLNLTGPVIDPQGGTPC